MCVPGALSLGDLEQQPPVRALAWCIPPWQRWNGAWSGSTEQHRSKQGAGGRGGCGEPLGVASRGHSPCRAGGCLAPPTKSNLDWGAWREIPSLWEGVRVCCQLTRRGFILADSRPLGRKADGHLAPDPAPEPLLWEVTLRIEYSHSCC